MPALRERTVVTTLRLPESVYFELRALCIDPTIVSGRGGRAIGRYRSWSEFFTALAQRHLDEVKVARISADEDTTE